MKKNTKEIIGTRISKTKRNITCVFCGGMIEKGTVRLRRAVKDKDGKISSENFHLDCFNDIHKHLCEPCLYKCYKKLVYFAKNTGCCMKNFLGNVIKFNEHNIKMKYKFMFDSLPVQMQSAPMGVLTFITIEE